MHTSGGRLSLTVSDLNAKRPRSAFTESVWTLPRWPAYRFGMTPDAYGQLLRVARRYARRADEADDLLQDALLEGVKVGRVGRGDADTMRWLVGVIRNQAAFAARTAARRRRRESVWGGAIADAEHAPRPPALDEIVEGLPPSLRSVAALALAGQTRPEIAYLLDLPDTALRQRVSSLKRHFACRGLGAPEATPALTLDLDYGRIRGVLKPLVVGREAAFAAHDPDGHLFLVRRAHKTPPEGNTGAPHRKTRKAPPA